MSVIPASAFYGQGRVGNGSFGLVYPVEIYPGIISVPSECTIELSSSNPFVATDPTYFLTMQSRDANGDSHDDLLGVDNYSVLFTRTDVGTTETYSTTAIAQGSGLYQANLSPTVAGTYQVDVTLTNPTYTSASDIIGSPFTLTVIPGIVDQSLSVVSVNSTPQTAGTPF